ncbi:lytic polysaccharide monooxygenase [Phytohabitans kaempferiae]|uniref:Lytic polysaccharide monooxygenase n=1 Tax=Phytohabitans kaempferiae TaxID=1620943 RepID=A0ABV6M271_9ACTN
MRRRITLPLLTVAAVLASLFVAITPAQAHGYISSPASRQAMCAQGRVANCGDIIYEPQSVEAPKGSMQCNGGGSRFAVLNDNSRNWPTTSVGQNVTFNWVLTARHATSTWEYFVGGTRIAVFDDGGRQPAATVSHNVSLGGRSGRLTVLARWNVADTAMAFYACVDLQVGGGGGNPPPTTQPPGPACGTAWSASAVYNGGAIVSHNGRRWQAQWWTQGETPGTTGEWGVWRDQGACG